MVQVPVASYSLPTQCRNYPLLEITELTHCSTLCSVPLVTVCGRGPSPSLMNSSPAGPLGSEEAISLMFTTQCLNIIPSLPRLGQTLSLGSQPCFTSHWVWPCPSCMLSSCLVLNLVGIMDQPRTSKSLSVQLCVQLSGTIPPPRPPSSVPHRLHGCGCQEGHRQQSDPAAC